MAFGQAMAGAAERHHQKRAALFLPSLRDRLLQGHARYWEVSCRKESLRKRRDGEGFPKICFCICACAKKLRQAGAKENSPVKCGSHAGKTAEPGVGATG